MQDTGVPKARAIPDPPAYGICIRDDQPEKRVHTHHSRYNAVDSQLQSHSTCSECRVICKLSRILSVTRMSSLVMKHGGKNSQSARSRRNDSVRGTAAQIGTCQPRLFISRLSSDSTASSGACMLKNSSQWPVMRPVRYLQSTQACKHLHFIICTGDWHSRDYVSDEAALELMGQARHKMQCAHAIQWLSAWIVQAGAYVMQ